MLYFSYGSNMLTPRLAARCPGARPVGRARLAGWRVGLEKHGRDGSGKATLLACDGRLAEGVVFDVPRAEHGALDRAEGAGFGYDRVTGLTAECGSDAVPVFTYVAPEPMADLPVFDWYLALIRAGCREHGLPERIAAWYAAHPAVPDPEPDRPGRRDALAALARAGMAV